MFCGSVVGRCAVKEIRHLEAGAASEVRLQPSLCGLLNNQITGVEVVAVVRCAFFNLFDLKGVTFPVGTVSFWHAKADCWSAPETHLECKCEAGTTYIVCLRSEAYMKTLLNLFSEAYTGCYLSSNKKWNFIAALQCNPVEWTTADVLLPGGFFNWKLNLPSPLEGKRRGESRNKQQQQKKHIF